MKAAIYQAKYYMDQSYCEQGIEEALNALDSCDESIDIIVMPESTDIPFLRIRKKYTRKR